MLSEGRLDFKTSPQKTPRLRARGDWEFVCPNQGLTDIPFESIPSSDIKVLRLVNNALTDLGKQIVRFAQLQVLSVSNNRLSVLQPDISHLVDLRRLWLDDNQLTELPPELGECTKLDRLSLQGNQLTHLTPEIGRLTNLRTLTLHGNQLTELPPEIGRLTNLRTLTLHGNQLAELPSEIGQLKSLERLSLHQNKLISLPPEIGQLTRLNELTLGDNQLESLPPQLGNLRGIRNLPLERNQLTRLPGSLAPIIHSIVLTGNPLAEPLPELIERGLPALTVYLNSLSDGVEQYEAKIMILGEGKVGKTSLVAALRRESFVENRPTTHGINIGSLILRHPQRDEVDMTLRTWDFGGQEVYRVTHQFFLSRRALYLLVWSARAGREQNEVESWLRRIRLRVGRDARVLLVATYCDERRPELDYPSLERGFPQMLAGQYNIDNRTSSGIDNLRDRIAQESSQLPHMGSFISKRWLDAREELTLRAETEPQIQYTIFVELCLRKGVLDSEIVTFATLLHDLGQIVYYDEDEGLRDIVVLKPEWLTKAISYVLEDEPTREAGGELDHARLRSIWTSTPDGESYPVRYHAYFLRLMEKFEISYRLEDDEHRSLVAQLVPFRRPNLPWDFSSPLSEGLRSLSLKCRLSEPGAGLISWLTVRHHASWTGKHWRNGVFLRHPIDPYASEALIELINPVEVLIQVRAPSPDLFFHVLRDSIETLIRRRWRGLSYELLVPCPSRGVNGIACSGAFPLNGLLSYREKGGVKYTCLACVTEHDVSMLLTGFTPSSASLQPELMRLQNELDAVAVGVGRIEHYAAETADSVRRVLGAVSAEVTDCPRLFTVMPAKPTGVDSLLFWRRHYRVTLWCEHPGHEHECRAARYVVKNPKEWFRRVGPYAAIVFRVLQLAVPVAAAITGVVLNEAQLKHYHEDFELMTTLAEKLPNKVWPDDATLGSAYSSNTLTATENAALRGFRQWLFNVDPRHKFGDLRRVQEASGQFIWVCSGHYGEYDPGLPSIPETR